MIQITKELAEAVIASYGGTDGYNNWCDHCDAESEGGRDIQHTPECIVTRAKLLLKLEWGITS